MATYLMLSTLTDEGRRTLKENPDRLEAVNQEIRSMGALVRSQFAVLGSYDFVNLIEAPNNEVVARISMELESRGTIRVLTLPAMAVNEFVQMMSQRQSASEG